MFTKQQLAAWREQRFEFDGFYDSVAVEEIKNETKILTIKFKSHKIEKEKHILVFEVTTPVLKNINATIFVEEIDKYFNDDVLKNNIILKSNSINIVTTSFNKNLNFTEYLFDDGNTFKATISCDGSSSESATFSLGNSKKKEEEKNIEKCLCKKTTWTADDLKYIVTQARKLQPMGKRQYKDEKTKNRLWLDKNGKVIPSTDRGRKPDEAVDGYYYPYSQYEDFIGNDEKSGMFEDKIFFRDATEKLEKLEKTYFEFAKQLNAVFIKYAVNNCLRKIHFLTQIYHETEMFTKTFEPRTNSGYSGGDEYVGRGMIHITNDFNYLRYYDYKKETTFFDLYKKYRLIIPMNKTQESVGEFNFRTKNLHIPIDKMIEVNEFTKLVASKMEYAVDAAGWYWKFNDSNIDINKLADADDLLRVSASVQHPSVAKSKNIKIGDVGGYYERKKKYDLFLKVFDYENCK